MPLAITMGDAAGIGPEIIAKAFLHSPQATRGWWVFHCACGELRTSFDDETCWPEGVQFECVGCGTWGHAACYPQAAQLAAAASATHPAPTILARRTVGAPITTGHTPMRVEDPTM